MALYKIMFFKDTFFGSIDHQIFVSEFAAVIAVQILASMQNLALMQNVLISFISFDFAKFLHLVL